jgi:octaheme c-type cytochrome (tetrathionate reductase family)
MKAIFIAAVMVLSVWIVYLFNKETPNSNLLLLKEKIAKEESKPVDHSKFEILQKDFATGSDVTEACIGCHTERHTEVMNSSHWNWSREEYIEGRGIVKIGKKNVINNFCIGIAGSEKLCNTCHAGYGWSDTTFDFNASHNVDCLACHDNSGQYKKGKNLAGQPDPSVDLSAVAQKVGKPKMENCGACHFVSGGGNNVKHGDLEGALYATTKDVDVHMGIDGADMECVECHTAENHKIKGKLYSVSSMNKDRMECESCHTATPHKEDIINEHTVKVACQTCHIPIYAKANSTKMTWDWSKAFTKSKDPEYHESDSLGNHTHLSKKGEFTWANNVKPEYRWFNGTADHYLLGDKIDEVPVQINSLKGNYSDKDSKIIPVKIHRTKQIYDTENNMLIQPKLFDSEQGKGALWVDGAVMPIEKVWDNAARAGMEYIGLPYSGNYGFIETEMYWPVNHMVSPKENSLKCVDCHTRNDSRLEGLNDFYMPGRDYNKAVEYFGIFLVLSTILFAITHGIARVFVSLKNKRKGE